MSRALFATTWCNFTCSTTSTSPSVHLTTLQPQRTISTFHPLRPITRLPPHAAKIDEQKIPYPPYPYGPNRTFPEADKGLYGGARPQSGNKVSQGRNKGKTLRRWHPNVRLERITSKALHRQMTIPITAACMRTIRKCGGLDQYVLGDKPARIKELGMFGWRLRWLVMNSAAMGQEYEKERKGLSLPQQKEQFTTFEKAWEKDDELRREVEEEQKEVWLEMKHKDERFRRHVETRWGPKYKKHTAEPLVPEFDADAFEALLRQPEVAKEESSRLKRGKKPSRQQRKRTSGLGTDRLGRKATSRVGKKGTGRVRWKGAKGISNPDGDQQVVKEETQQALQV